MRLPRPPDDDRVNRPRLRRGLGALAALYVLAAIFIVTRVGLSGHVMEPLPLALLLGGMFALGLAVIAVALTQLWRANELKGEATAARLQAMRLNLAISETSDGIALTDPEGRFTLMNKAHLKMFGIESQDAATEMHWTDVYAGAERERLRRDIMPDLKRDRHWRGAAVATTPAGAPVEQEVSLTLLDDGGILCIARDMTGIRADERSRRRLEEQLLVAQKMEAVGRLTSGFAHDFNNVLASIQGYAEILRDDAPETSPGRRFAGQILTATKRGRTLVERILGFGRPARDSTDSCDLGTAVEEAVGLLSGAMPPSITLSSAGTTPGLTVGLSSDQLMQVLMNLGVNARDALGEREGSIRLATGEAPLPEGWAHVRIGQRRPATAYACVRVEDNGDGIAEEQMVRIFEPFFTTKVAGAGTGLGLAAVHSIMAGCGGEIVLASKPGAGTRFDLHLPLLAIGVQPSPAASATAMTRPKLRVLIAEDDDMLREALAEALGRHGFTVHAAHDGKEALDHLDRHPGEIDILLTDESMPVMRGSEMIRRLRHAGSRLPIVLWSANADPALLEAEGLIGAASTVEFCRKPASTDDLIAALNRAVNAA
ncbi:hybrid sensor histidine kinase/response regulator [Zavarzinia sp.]|uniref:hybrid sensor histidine kinase/response regulator n=1 Tax=Zavarzinia sp. TaxID=2027920 RepID=UPI003BB78DCF